MSQGGAGPGGVSVGHFVPGTVIQGNPVPHHPGAPGSTPVVVGIPISQRAEQAIATNSLPQKVQVGEIKAGAKILDDNPLMPEKRPYRDVAFAVLFLVVVLALIAGLSFVGGEIPDLINRAGTMWESFPGKVCGMERIDTWPTGESTTASAALRQRLSVNATSSRRLAAAWLGGSDDAFDGLAASPVLELPGLSSFIRRMELLGLPTGSTEVDDDHAEFQDLSGDALGAAGRRLQFRTGRTGSTGSRAEAPPPPERDCERACAAFPECVAFDVEVLEGTTTCTYQRKPSGGPIPSPVRSDVNCSSQASDACTACWRKKDSDVVSTAASSFIVWCLGMTLAGACVSMITAFGFVKLASVQPAAATYVGVYFVPGCMIFVGVVVIATLFPFIGLTAIILGGLLSCLGTCFCGLTWFCYRDLIPLTIEVIAAVTSVITRSWSMLCISACGSIAGILWSFLCMATVLGALGRIDRESATTPQAAPIASGGVSYVPYFFMMVVYFWGGYVCFNTCHVAFAGVFGRWYFGKSGSSPVSSSVKTAFTTAFGSVCLGSLIIAMIRALEEVMRKLQRDAAENGNVVVQIIACVLRCIISCIGDILEWISSYVFVQCAIRGISFYSSARATYALATISNLAYVCSAILVNMVVGMGAVLCGISGAAIAGLLGYLTCGVPGFCVYVAVVGAVFGCMAGIVAGGSGVGVMDSGAKTVLMCWAEQPDVLEGTHPEIHRKFRMKTDQIY